MGCHLTWPMGLQAVHMGELDARQWGEKQTYGKFWLAAVYSHSPQRLTNVSAATNEPKAKLGKSSLQNPGPRAIP